MLQNRSKSGAKAARSNGRSNFHRELRVFEAQKNSWMQAHANSFVVISGDAVAGFFPSFADAYTAAVAQFGLDRQFLIKQVLGEDQVLIVY